MVLFDWQVLPRAVSAVLQQLSQHGYKAYIVGGAVRDICAGRQPQDYDIATNARPEAVASLAGKLGWRVVEQLGRNFGVVVVVVDRQPVEVATFRGERYGEDSHRPTAVWYAETIEEDLARRDFTINAMALSITGELVDPFGGREDFAAGIIRTVGDPNQRFAEDALRMFRACRFVAQLGFRLDSAAQRAIKANLGRVAGLSLARVRDELEKTLLGQYSDRGLDLLVKTGLAGASCRRKQSGQYQAVPILPELEHLVDLPQNPQFHRYDGWQHTLAAVRAVPPDLTLRWAALLHDVGKEMPHVRGFNEFGQPTDHGHDRVGAQMADALLTRLEYPLRFRQRIVWLISQHMRFFAYCNGNNWPSAKRWVRQTARQGFCRQRAELAEAFEQLGTLCLADVIGSQPNDAALNRAKEFKDYLVEIARNMPVHTSDLDYDAGEIASVLGSPELVGRFLQICLQRVQDGNLANERWEIIEAAARWGRRQGSKAGDRQGLQDPKK